METTLLSEPHVINWLRGDVSFLKPETGVANRKILKTYEDIWGRATLKKLRPDLRLHKQWTNLFGEYICKEILTREGYAVSKPACINHFQPDLETPDFIVEVKTGTFHTTGTAGEKILGCPYKYAEIPKLYGKPLKIYCIGGAEKMCREHFGIIGNGPKCTPMRRKFLDFFRENDVEFVGVTDILDVLSLTQSFNEISTG